MSDDQGSSKIQIDSDWKAEAEAEKAKLDEQSKHAEGDEGGGASSAGGAGGSGVGGGSPQIPPATLETIVNEYARHAFTFLGVVPEPTTGRRMTHLDLARHYIDLLGVIQEKTKGNLTEDEEKMLTSMLYELRQGYIQVSTAANQQAISGGVPAR